MHLSSVHRSHYYSASRPTLVRRDTDSEAKSDLWSIIGPILLTVGIVLIIGYSVCYTRSFLKSRKLRQGILGEGKHFQSGSLRRKRIEQSFHPEFATPFSSPGQIEAGVGISVPENSHYRPWTRSGYSEGTPTIRTDSSYHTEAGWPHPMYRRSPTPDDGFEVAPRAGWI